MSEEHEEAKAVFVQDKTGKWTYDFDRAKYQISSVQVNLNRTVFEAAIIGAGKLRFTRIGEAGLVGNLLQVTRPAQFVRGHLSGGSIFASDRYADVEQKDTIIPVHAIRTITVLEIHEHWVDMPKRWFEHETFQWAEWRSPADGVSKWFSKQEWETEIKIVLEDRPAKKSRWRRVVGR